MTNKHTHKHSIHISYLYGIIIFFHLNMFLWKWNECAKNYSASIFRCYPSPHTLYYYHFGNKKKIPLKMSKYWIQNIGYFEKFHLWKNKIYLFGWPVTRKWIFFVVRKKWPILMDVFFFFLPKMIFKISVFDFLIFFQIHVALFITVFIKQQTHFSVDFNDSRERYKEKNTRRQKWK